MGPAELSGFAAIAVSVIVSIFIPYLRNKRKTREDIDATKLVSWQSITKVLQDENDALRTKQDRMEAEYRTKFAALEAEYTTQISTARARITELEDKVETLQAKIFRLQNPAS